MRTFRNKIGADNSRKCLLTRERFFNETGPKLPLKSVVRTFTNEHISYNTSLLRSFKVEAALTIPAANMGEMSNSQFSDLHRTELVCGIRLSFDSTDRIYCNCCLSKRKVIAYKSRDFAKTFVSGISTQPCAVPINYHSDANCCAT